MYEYHAEIVKVVDGDTVDLKIDLGFTVSTQQRVRLAGINAAEHNTQQGILAKNYLVGLLPAGTKVIVRSEKPGGGDKYGRYLATITIDPNDPITVNDALVASGHALRWDGSGVKPV